MGKKEERLMHIKGTNDYSTEPYPPQDIYQNGILVFGV
jgi:hypothetical protein